VIAEPAGIWFIENRMNMPPDRLDAAHWVYQFSLLAFVINIISVPYNASIIAHEKMSAFAIIGIFEGLAKLGVAILIMHSPVDRLIAYSILMCVVAAGVRVAYTVYCRKFFEECRFRFIWDGKLLRQMFSFAGWNFIGVTSSALRDHGGNILVNIFSGPAANAARAVSVQLGGAVQSFVTNFMTAVNPQITKSYAADDRNYTMELVFRSSRYSFYLLSLIALPILLNAGFLLDLWLENVPARSEAFVCLALILSLSECLSNPLVTLMLATGNIRNYQLVVGGFQLFNLPVSYLILRAGAPPESILVVAIVISQICLFARLIMLRNMTGLPIGKFLKQVYLRIMIVVVLAYLPSWWISSFMGDNFWSVISSCVVTLLITVVVIWIAGLTSSERMLLKSKLVAFIERRC
jgi:O-antigen/teichoic acid export membrane protein